MKFCQECGVQMTSKTEQWICADCGWTLARDSTDGLSGSGMSEHPGTTALERLPTTDSGAIRKPKAMEWLANRGRPSDRELLEVVTPKPKSHTGSTFATDISNVRVTGDAAFIETIAGLLQPFLKLESGGTRLEINLQQVTDRDTGE